MIYCSFIQNYQGCKCFTLHSHLWSLLNGIWQKSTISQLPSYVYVGDQTAINFGGYYAFFSHLSLLFRICVKRIISTTNFHWEIRVVNVVRGLKSRMKWFLKLLWCCDCVSNPNVTEIKISDQITTQCLHMSHHNHPCVVSMLYTE